MTDQKKGETGSPQYRRIPLPIMSFSHPDAYLPIEEFLKKHPVMERVKAKGTPE